jgi:hypothetical protein
MRRISLAWESWASNSWSGACERSWLAGAAGWGMRFRSKVRAGRVLPSGA